MTNDIREDAIEHRGRYIVPTTEKTIWVDSWNKFKAVGGVQAFNEDQTTITLKLPVGHKFSIRFNEQVS